MASPFVQVVRRETSRIAGSWVLIFATIVAPVAVFLIVTWMFSAGVVRNLPIAIVDNDNSSMSRNISRMVDATSSAHIACRPASLIEAEKLMLKGKIEAVLVLPDGFERTTANWSDYA